MITLETIGTFTWSFHHRFHIETDQGNYEWSDPDYPGGDNTIHPCQPYNVWCNLLNIPFGRDKGTHRIRDYCGNNVSIFDNTL